MAQIEMTMADIRMMREMLMRYLPDLRIEIADTDDKEFRRYLEERESFMKDFAQRLEREFVESCRWK